MIKTLNPTEARTLLWKKGIVHWLLHAGQKSLYDSYHNCNQKIVTWLCSRRFGKSYALCVLAIEQCLKQPNSLVKYCCAKQNDAKNIIRPLIREIINTCPKELRPTFKVYERAYVFPNGSRIELSGLDAGRAESLRGGNCSLALIDEAGLVTDLKHIVRSIILPTTAMTKGKIVMASTPPKSSDHSFIFDFVNKARIEKNLVVKTVLDNPIMDKEELDKIIEEYGGETTVEYRREFLCHIIIDENRAVVPEFNSDLKERIVKKWPRPPFYDCYVSMDLGLKDLTVVLFSYYDFRNDKLIIEDEFVLNGHKFTTDALAAGIRRKETENFTDHFTLEQKKPYLRISDNNLIVINDLFQLHGLHFLPTRKDDSDAALNNVRMMIANEQIIINPKCETLIRHLETATWNKARSSYDRGNDGHFDAIDSLKYLVRNIQFGKNPYPATYGMGSQYDRFKMNKSPAHPSAEQFQKLLNMNPRRK